MSASRRVPTNCQNEPHYPGIDTVTFSIRYPELTCHYPTTRCAIQPPHAIAECGEWIASTPEAMRREIDGEPRLGMHRPGLLPGMGRDAEMDQRVFDALTLRREGMNYAEIGRHIGRCRNVAKHYCDWYGARPLTTTET